MARSVARLLDPPGFWGYAAGCVLWFGCLWFVARSADALFRGGSDYALFLILCCLLLMLGAVLFRLPRVFLVVLLLCMETALFAYGHDLLAYKIAAFFSTGFLLILWGEKDVDSRGMLEWRHRWMHVAGK